MVAGLGGEGGLRGVLAVRVGATIGVLAWVSHGEGDWRARAEALCDGASRGFEIRGLACVVAGDLVCRHGRRGCGRVVSGSERLRIFFDRFGVEARVEGWGGDGTRNLHGHLGGFGFSGRHEGGDYAGGARARFLFGEVHVGRTTFLDLLHWR